MRKAEAAERPHVFAWEWTLFISFLAAGVVVLTYWPDAAWDLSLRSWAAFISIRELTPRN